MNYPLTFPTTIITRLFARTYDLDPDRNFIPRMKLLPWLVTAPTHE